MSDTSIREMSEECADTRAFASAFLNGSVPSVGETAERALTHLTRCKTCRQSIEPDARVKMVASIAIGRR